MLRRCLYGLLVSGITQKCKRYNVLIIMMIGNFHLMQFRQKLVAYFFDHSVGLNIIEVGSFDNVVGYMGLRAWP